MHEISRRFAERGPTALAPRATFDEDERPGELRHAIDRARTGDEDALRYLYLRYSGNVYGYTRSIIRDEHEAEDVTQQVFVRLITAIRSYEHRGVPFSAWILRIAHNMAIDHLRRQRPTPSTLEWVTAEPTDDPRGDLAMEVRSAISELPETQREVVVLRHIMGWSPPEIAEHLGRSEEAVHGLHHRGRRALQGGLTRRNVAPVTMTA